MIPWTRKNSGETFSFWFRCFPSYIAFRSIISCTQAASGWKIMLASMTAWVLLLQTRLCVYIYFTDVCRAPWVNPSERRKKKKNTRGIDKNDVVSLQTDENRRARIKSDPWWSNYNFVRAPSPLCLVKLAENCCEFNTHILSLHNSVARLTDVHERRKLHLHVRLEKF